MKHKAQEALDNLVKVSCPKRTTCKECDIKDVCNSFGKDYISTIQQSIDNQLTVEEIRTISTAINHLEVDYLLGDLLNSEKKSLKRIPGIRDKLKNQKELWEIE